MASSARRWSMSVWVMTSPLTIALALTTAGIGAEQLWVLRQVERAVLFRGPAGLPGVCGACPSAAPPSAATAASEAIRRGRESVLKASCHVEPCIPCYFKQFTCALRKPAERR
jgi:hypothetical protein